MKRIKVLKIPVELCGEFLYPITKYYRGIEDSIGHGLAQLLNIKFEYDIIKDNFREVSEDDYTTLIKYIVSANQSGTHNFNYIVFVDDYCEDEDFDALLQLARTERETIEQIRKEKEKQAQEKEKQAREKKAAADKKREEKRIQAAIKLLQKANINENY